MSTDPVTSPDTPGIGDRISGKATPAALAAAAQRRRDALPTSTVLVVPQAAAQPRRLVTREAGHQLRTWRWRHGLTVALLADRIGCARSTLARIEAGKRAPGPTTAEAIIRALALTGAEAAWVRSLADHPDHPQETP